MLPSWTLTVTGAGQSKPGEQVMIKVIALLLMLMEIAMLQVVLSGSVTFSTTALINSGEYDIFVVSWTLTVTWLWKQKAGGTSGDFGNGIAVDANGNSYVTGNFWSSATFGTTTLTSSGGYDIFVAKLDINGNWL